jgi:pimeloyl-ACP methyl ester carboxylesterase
MRFALVLLFVVAASSSARGREGVILLHGLARTDRSMVKLASALERDGYVVVNVDYPSRTGTIEVLADSTIRRALEHPEIRAAQKVHFVTHSLGGILVRQYLKSRSIDRLGRVVMLGPPNQGSEVVDRLGDVALFGMINGPAGQQLGTGTGSVPNRLGPVPFELGIIAGDRSINWINSAIIPGPDDGKVSVARTKVTGMKEHIIIHVSHPFLMRNEQVIGATLRFLRSGTFREVDTPAVDLAGTRR